VETDRPLSRLRLEIRCGVANLQRHLLPPSVERLLEPRLRPRRLSHKTIVAMDAIARGDGGLAPSLCGTQSSEAATRGESVLVRTRPPAECSAAEAGGVEAALALVERLELDRYHHLRAPR
jgi:hypothetical protein